jgi:hypothetical protein
MNKVYCPKCGCHHEPLPVSRKPDPDSNYEDEAPGETGYFSMESCHIEAGPYDGRNNLLDYDMLLCECPKCNNVFASDPFDEGEEDSGYASEYPEREYSVDVTRIGIGNLTIKVTACTQKEANEKAIDEAGSYDFSEHTSEYEVN